MVEGTNENEKVAFNVHWLLGFRLILYSVCDFVMHLCPFCNRRTINLLDDDDDERNISIAITQTKCLKQLRTKSNFFVQIFWAENSLRLVQNVFLIVKEFVCCTDPAGQRHVSDFFVARYTAECGAYRCTVKAYCSGYSLYASNVSIAVAAVRRGIIALFLSIDSPGARLIVT